MGMLFLFLDPGTAKAVETVVQDRIEVLDGIECPNPTVRAELEVEHARLLTVAAQLKAPTT